MAATAAALLIRWLLNPLLDHRLPFITLYGAIAIAVWFGGWRPALLATILGYIAADQLFIEPEPGAPLSLKVPGGLAGTAIYFASCLIVISLGSGMRTAQRRSEAAVLEAHSKQRQLENEMAEHRRTEEALRESEALKAAVLEAALDAIITMDHEGKVVEFNPAAERMFGYRRNDVVGQVMADIIIPPSQRENHRRGLARYLATGEGPVLNRRVEMTAQRADGTEFPVELAITPLAKDGPKVFTGHIRDVTERKRAEAALQASEAKFATAFRQSPLALTITSLDSGRLVEVNEGFVRLTGYTREEALGRTPGELRLWLKPERHAEGLARLRAGESLSDVEARFRTKTGQELVGMISSSVIQINSRPHVISSVADITVRKQAEAALRKSEERFRMLADSSPVLIWVNGLNGCEFVNRAYLQFLGVVPVDVQNFDWAQFVHPEDREMYVNVCSAAFTRREPFAAEFRFRRADGEYRWMKSAGLPRLSETGAFEGYVGSTFDITERKQREEQLRQDLATERGITETLQRSLLPDRLPHIEGVGLAVRYIPASPEAAVGGDFYDVFTLPNGHLGLAIGDVAGHGVQAATAMGQVRMLLRAYAHEGHAPAGVIDRLNRLLGSGEMVTVLYLVLDSMSGQMTYANAGHPPPLVVTPDGTSRFLEGTDPPLVGGSHRYNTFGATVAPTSTVILYTDGLVESDKSIDIGLTRLAEISQTVASVDLEAAASAIVTELIDSTVRRDDVALLALRLQPTDPTRFRVVLPTVPQSLPTFRFSLRRWLEVGNIPAQTVFDIVVACGEAATNAVEHAYGPGDGTFEVEANRNADRIVVWIRDKGVWRPRRAGQGGRGLMIMQKLMDSVDVVRGPGGTTVQLERRLRLPAEV